MTKKKSFVGATIFDGFKRHLNAALIIKNSKVVEIIPEEKVDPKTEQIVLAGGLLTPCLLYTSPSPRDMRRSRMPSSA